MKNLVEELNKKIKEFGDKWFDVILIDENDFYKFKYHTGGNSHLWLDTGIEPENFTGENIVKWIKTELPYVPLESIICCSVMRQNENLQLRLTLGSPKPISTKINFFYPHVRDIAINLFPDNYTRDNFKIDLDFIVFLNNRIRELKKQKNHYAPYVYLLKQLDSLAAAILYDFESSRYQEALLRDIMTSGFVDVEIIEKVTMP